jgi:prepilin-type N-terminal cleavage/methylation domain-containing protein
MTRGFTTFSSHERGFTLIELLIVIAILGILAGGVVVAIDPLAKINSANLAKVETFAASMQNSLAMDLVGEWTFDEGAVNDTSGYGNITTNHGATPTTDRRGRANKAYSFNGTTNYVDAENGSSLNITGNEITIEFWVKTGWDAPHGYEYQYAFGKSGNTYMLNFFRDLPGPTTADIIFYINGNTTARTGNLLSTYANKWFHFAAVYDGSTVKFYIDGVLFKTVLLAVGNINDSSSLPLQIGRVSDVGRVFRGIFDDVRIYKSALLSYQVKQLYAQGLIKHQLTLK